MDTKRKLNSDKQKSLGWMPEVGLKEAYERLMVLKDTEESSAF